jgi:prepilin-type N-terminal cleavage/methylation domain-containing protein
MRRAFTLLEMMAAIGIILVLLAIGVIGFRSVSAKGDRDLTMTTMRNLKSMEAEYEAVKGASGLSQIALPVTVPTTDDGAVHESRPGNWRDPAATLTQRVTGALVQIPKNKTAFANLSSKSQMKDKVPPVAQDAWRNPIIYVPRSGLLGVRSEGKPDRNVPVTSPDGRPFWASAGPDGFFGTGDDNLYSFQ